MQMMYKREARAVRDHNLGGGFSDRFVFGAGSGLDTIHDFQQGKDTIDAGGYGVTSFAQLTIANDVVAFDGAADGAGNEVTVLASGNIPVVLAASDFSIFGA